MYLNQGSFTLTDGDQQCVHVCINILEISQYTALKFWPQLEMAPFEQ